MLPLRKPLQLPSTTKDRIALSVFTFGGIFLLWYEAGHVLPFYYKEATTTVLIQYGIAAWLAFNIYGNMYMLITTDLAVPERVAQAGEPKEDWRPNCIICQRQGPPRSYHCKLCQVCVLKRDHHCWFAGNCIGYYNHRYYVVMVIYMNIAAIYCNIFNLSFVSYVAEGLGLWKILSILFPHVGLFFGYTDGYTFAIFALTTIGLVWTWMFLWLLKIQIAQIKSCQTQYEKKMQIVKYDIGWKNYIVEVFGDRWYLVWLCPWIQSPLPGDGISFPLMEFKDKQY